MPPMDLTPAERDQGRLQLMQALQKIVGGDQARAQSLATRTEENIYENTVTRAQWGHHMSSKINSILAKNNQVAARSVTPAPAPQATAPQYQPQPQAQQQYQAQAQQQYQAQAQQQYQAQAQPQQRQQYQPQLAQYPPQQQQQQQYQAQAQPQSGYAPAQAAPHQYQPAPQAPYAGVVDARYQGYGGAAPAPGTASAAAQAPANPGGYYDAQAGAYPPQAAAAPPQQAQYAQQYDPQYRVQGYPAQQQPQYGAAPQAQAAPRTHQHQQQQQGVPQGAPAQQAGPGAYPGAYGATKQQYAGVQYAPQAQYPHPPVQQAPPPQQVQQAAPQYQVAATQYQPGPQPQYLPQKSDYQPSTLPQYSAQQSQQASRPPPMPLPGARAAAPEAGTGGGPSPVAAYRQLQAIARRELLKDAKALVARIDSVAASRSGAHSSSATMRETLALMEGPGLPDPDIDGAAVEALRKRLADMKQYVRRYQYAMAERAKQQQQQQQGVAAAAAAARPAGDAVAAPGGPPSSVTVAAVAATPGPTATISTVAAGRPAGGTAQAAPDPASTSAAVAAAAAKRAAASRARREAEAAARVAAVVPLTPAERLVAAVGDVDRSGGPVAARCVASAQRVRERTGAGGGGSVGGGGAGTIRDGLPVAAAIVRVPAGAGRVFRVADGAAGGHAGAIHPATDGAAASGAEAATTDPGMAPVAPSPDPDLRWADTLCAEAQAAARGAARLRVLGASANGAALVACEPAGEGAGRWATLRLRLEPGASSPPTPVFAPAPAGEEAADARRREGAKAMLLAGCEAQQPPTLARLCELWSGAVASRA
ncbi:hypothetical protein ACKKBF_B03125 [Auxenochlorella protothecoides x Auxenochlorella symbiontica]